MNAVLSARQLREFRPIPHLVQTDRTRSAKRYERMLKAHGIHPHGGPLDSSSGVGERSTGAMKASRKRKLDDTSPFMYHIERKDRKPPMPSQSPRTPGPHHINSEMSSMGYQPYTYYPTTLHQPPSMQRPMPRFLPQITGAMLRSAEIPPPYSMMPAMAHNKEFVKPPNQSSPFPMNQPPLASTSSDPDQKDLNPFDDFWNSDSTRYESFEGLLNGDSSTVNYICDNDETHPQMPQLD